MIPISIILDDKTAGSCLMQATASWGEFYVQGIYGNPWEAMEGLQDSPPEIVIMELIKQDTSPLKWIREISARSGIAKWIVYTVFTNDEMVFSALHAGVTGYIVKEPSADNLKWGLQETINGGFPFSPSILQKVLGSFRQPDTIKNRAAMLSIREKEILHFTSRGLLYKEIASQLGIRRETVKKHLANIYEKLEVENKIEAVNKFYGYR